MFLRQTLVEDPVTDPVSGEKVCIYVIPSRGLIKM